MAPRRAVATVTFENAGTPTMVKLDLVMLRIGWHIRDVHAGSRDLRAVLGELIFILGILRSRGTIRSCETHRRLAAGPHGLRRASCCVCSHGAAQCEDTRRRFGRTNRIWWSEGVLAERS
jgi:hypothetical protein